MTLDANTELERPAHALSTQHAELVEKTIAMLGWMGWFPDHIHIELRRDTDGQTTEDWIMLGERDLAVISVIWPSMFVDNFLVAGNFRITLELRLGVPPLCMERG